ncbi:MAG: glutamate racemase, partial [Clostridiaceae bacterium]|nr:glutamate racemase [Clostridiaceae bacterium]
MINGKIGVFDSGIGGLTVLKEIIKQLPHEDIIYFGDGKRTPYGGKSKQTIELFALQSMKFLIQRGAKAIVIACNTVSSNAMD